MRVVLFGGFPEPYRISMEVYGENFRAALSWLLSSQEMVIGYQPAGIQGIPKLARYWAQYVGYPWRVRRIQGDVNHVVDHAYAHLLYALDPSRTVVTFHDAHAFQSLNPMRRLILSGLRKAAAVICVSQASRRDFLQLIPSYPVDRVTVIHQGMAERFFQSPNGDPKESLGLPPGRYILHVGHNKFYKNIPALFSVLSIVSQRHPDIRLLKVGEAFTPGQKRLYRDLGIQDRIVHLGFLPEDRLALVYRAAEVLLYPSWNEGFGFPVLEAMASGTPVVASNRGALPEVVADAGILVDPQNHVQMAQKVMEILQDRTLKGQLKEAGIVRARGFTWEKTARKTLEVYRQVYRSC